MKHLLIVVLGATLLGGCGSSGPAGPTEPTGGTPAKIKRTVISFTSTDATAIGSPTKKSQVYLQLTDERGHTLSHDLGVFDGTCAAVAPASPDVLGD